MLYTILFIQIKYDLRFSDVMQRPAAAEAGMPLRLKRPGMP
jgi:hypothetical protein